MVCRWYSINLESHPKWKGLLWNFTLILSLRSWLEKMMSVLNHPQEWNKVVQWPHQFLFVLYFQAANEVVDFLAPASSIVFKSKNDFIFTGRKTITESDSEFQFDKSLYADDKTKLYESRESWLLVCRLFLQYSIKRFGLTCHTEASPRQKLCSSLHQVRNTRRLIWAR